MMKRILCTLLCVAMALGTLAGCGKEETKVETENNDVLVEVENDTTTTTKEEETTNTPIVEAERPEGMVVGKVNYTDWGSYTVVDSANGLDNIEVEFYGQAFKATVPQDMGNLAEGNGSNQVDISNKNQTKLLKAWFSLDMEDKVADELLTESEWRYFLTDSTYEEGYYFNKEWINEDLLKVVFEADFNAASGKTLHGYAVFYTDYKNGGCFQYFYGEDVSIYNDDVAKIVIESIEMMSFEELSALNNVSVSNANSDGSLNQDVLDKYGISKDALSLTADSIITDNNNMLSISTSNLAIDDANKILNNFVSTSEVFDVTGNKVSSPINLTLQNDIAYQALYYKSGDVWNEISFSYINIENAQNLNISIKQNVTIMF